MTCRDQGCTATLGYPGKFGIPDYIVNTPQKTAQWWLVATLVIGVFTGQKRQPGLPDSKRPVS